MGKSARAAFSAGYTPNALAACKTVCGSDQTPPPHRFPYIHDLPSGVDGLVILEARCYPGFTDDQIVKAAWNFDVINDHYRIERSAARYTCYAQRNGPIPPRLSICLGSKVPA
jgi:hypothetical protein